MLIPPFPWCCLFGLASWGLESLKNFTGASTGTSDFLRSNACLVHLDLRYVMLQLLGSRPKEQEDRDLTRLQLSLANHGAIFLGFGPLSVKEHDMKSCHDFSDASVSFLILWFWPVCHLA